MIDTDTYLEDPVLFRPHSAKAPLQVARWSGKRKAIAFGAVSDNEELPTGSVLIEISATRDCYIRFGVDNSVVASNVVADDASRLYLSGVQTVLVPFVPGTSDRYSWIAAVQETDAGILQVEKLS